MKIRTIAAALLLLICPLLCIPECSASPGPGLLITEVQPVGTEGFTLYNPGQEDLNLKGFYMSDGEGRVSFTKNLIIPSRTEITFSFDITSNQTFLNRPDEPNRIALQIGENGIVADGRFKLADAGDDLYVHAPDGRILDSVCWGNVTATGWIDEPLQRPSKDRYLVRCSPIDTDSSKDWKLSRPGMTDKNFGTVFEADVIPFVFPESEGTEIFRILEAAEYEVLISIYQITSVNVIALLCELAEKGVEVTILLEGSPLGGKDTTTLERTMMKSLVDSGGNVRLINDTRTGASEGTGYRFTYVHTKYAIIDRYATIITSENWTQSNLSPGNGNRGWGAIIKSEGYAEYMRKIFLNDSSNMYGDCADLLNLYPEQSSYPGNLTYSGISSEYESPVTFTDCLVYPVLSPDNSYDTLKSFIESAETRVYAEQMDISNSYMGIASDSPVSWMVDRTYEGIDGRLLLDLTFDQGGKASEIGLINTTTSLKAAGITGGENFSLTHNKGVIADNSVWIGSVNWTDTSFFRNRESAVIIRSEEVSNFFTEYFMKDWNDNDSNSELTAELFRIPTISENIHCFEADVFPNGNYVYKWDIYGDGILIRNSVLPKIVCENLNPGDYTLIVEITEESTGKFTTAHLAYTIEEPNNERTIIDNPVTVYLIIGIIAAAAIVAYSKSNKSKGKEEL